MSEKWRMLLLLSLAELLAMAVVVFGFRSDSRVG